jgi:hypothetical protein
MADVELLQLQLKQKLLKEKLLKEKTKEVETKQKVETEQKPVTFEDNLLSWMASGGQTPPPFYNESEVEGQVSPETFGIFQQFMNKPTSGGTSIAQDMAKSGLELAEAGKSEIVDVPDTVDIYSEGGKQLDIPPMAQTVLEKIANTVITGLGYAEAGVGFTVGSIADALVKAGMNESSARRLAKDVMAMPEAFAGSPSMFFKSKGELIKPEMPTTIKNIDTKKTTKTTQDLSPEEKEVVEIIRSASSGGVNEDKAIKKLLELAKVNPNIKEMAERLGFDLPFDIYADSDLIKRAAGSTRDVKGSTAEILFRQQVIEAKNRADEIIKELGATDLSTISFKIEKNLQETIDGLKTREGDFYDRVDGNEKKNIVGLVDHTEKANLTNTLNEINKIAKKLGGEKFLKPNIKAILQDEDYTYGRLLDLKEQIGNGAFKNKGEYIDTTTSTLIQIYDALKKDQFANAVRIGGNEVESLLKNANSLTVKRKELQDAQVAALGKVLQGSIAPKLSSVFTGGTKGDISNFNKFVDIVPEDFRKEALLTAIEQAVTVKDKNQNLNFGFAQFNTLYQKLKKQKVVFNKLKKELGPETTKVLDELAIISNRINQAEGNIEFTGKANQALVNAIQARSMLEKFMTGNMFPRAVQGAAGALGGMAFGSNISSGIAATIFSSLKFNSKDRLKIAGDLFGNVKFRQMIDEVAQTGSVSEETLSSVAKLPIYKRWAKSMGIDDGRNWLQGAVVTTAESPPSEADEALDTIVEEQSSLDQSSAAQDIIKSVTPSTIDKIRQYA